MGAGIAHAGRTTESVRASGGSVAYADPANRFAFAFLETRLTAGDVDHRLGGEVRAALDLPSGDVV